MSRRNITIEESSPLIVYLPPEAWYEGWDYVQQYSNHAFRLTNTTNATSSFQFNGTGVWVHGARRDNHGPYLASIDGRSTLLNGFVNATLDVDSSPLFSAPNLQPGLHTVTLTNTPTNTSQPYLSIDYIVLEIGIPDQTTRSIDDSGPSIVYSPKQEWVENNCVDVSQYLSYTCHSTASSFGKIQLAFQGDAITVTGGVGPNYGLYNVSIDGTPRGQYNAGWPNHHSLQLLYVASGLGSGNHTLEIQSRPESVGDIMDIDQIQVFGGNATTLDNSPSQTSGLGRKSLPAGLIAGVVVGAVAIIMIAALIPLVYKRWRRRGVKALDLNHENSSASIQIQDLEPDPYVSPSTTGIFMYPTHPSNGSHRTTHYSPSTTNLGWSATESDIGSSSMVQAAPTFSTVSFNEKFEYISRDPHDETEPPPYDPGRT